MNYYPYYQQPQNDERIWVPNENAAEAYLMAPNSFVRLWDSARPVFYEKRTDATGRPFPMETYEYSKKQNTNFNIGNDDVKEQIEALTQRIEALESKKVSKNAKSNTDDAISIS